MKKELSCEIKSWKKNNKYLLRLSLSPGIVIGIRLLCLSGAIVLGFPVSPELVVLVLIFIIEFSSGEYGNPY